MNDTEFMRQQQAAVERMKEMSNRSTRNMGNHNMPPVPSFVRLQGEKNQNNARKQTPLTVEPPKKEEKASENPSKGGFLEGLNIPFLDKLKGDSDIALIIGLILILMSEKADKRLLFALVYILM